MLILRNPARHGDNRQRAVFFGAECRCGWTTKLTENPLDMTAQQLAHTKKTRHTRFWEYEITRHPAQADVPG
jgi:hypothetical protein